MLGGTTTPDGVVRHSKWSNLIGDAQIMSDETAILKAGSIFFRARMTLSIVG